MRSALGKFLQFGKTAPLYGPRPALHRSRFGHLRASGRTVNSVSYTHLDVYKRQKQGCTHYLYFYSTEKGIYREALDECYVGISMNGERMNNIRYTNDTVIFADSLERLRQLMNRVTEAAVDMV